MITLLNVSELAGQGSREVKVREEATVLVRMTPLFSHSWKHCPALHCPASLEGHHCFFVSAARAMVALKGGAGHRSASRLLLVCLELLVVLVRAWLFRARRNARVSEPLPLGAGTR
jgi:hypothetical protein